MISLHETEKPPLYCTTLVDDKHDHFFNNFFDEFCHSIYEDYSALTFFLPTWRRETMKILEYFFGVRVFWPLPAGLPQRVLRRRKPRPWRCSPPPYGWSTGF